MVELDGGQHVEQQEPDLARIRFLSEQGYRVLRFWDPDVLTNPDGVLEQILAALKVGAEP